MTIQENDSAPDPLWFRALERLAPALPELRLGSDDSRGTSRSGMPARSAARNCTTTAPTTGRPT